MPDTDDIRDLAARRRQHEPPPLPTPDLATAVAIADAARTAVAATPATSGAERYLLNRTARLRPALPPVDVVRRWDDRLAELIAQTHAAHGAAVHALTEWEQGRPGGGAFAALAAERHAQTLDHLDAHDGDPPPVTTDTALVDHLAHGVHRLYVEALDAATRAEWADRRARDYARAAVDLRDRLDTESDAIRDEMAVHLLAAADRKSRFDLEAARQLRQPWGEATALYLWVCNPNAAYVDRRHTAGPSEVGYYEWEAIGAVEGTPPAMLPDPPPPDLAARWGDQRAAAHLEETTATATAVGRRLFGKAQQ